MCIRALRVEGSSDFQVLGFRSMLAASGRPKLPWPPAKSGRTTC